MGLTITKRKGSPYWYVRGTIKGVSVFESTGIPHAGKSRPTKLVEEVRDRRTKELQESLVYGKTQSATFLDAAVLYLEGGGSPRFLGKIIKSLGALKLRDIDQATLTRAATELYPDCTSQTINRQFWTPFIAVWRNAAGGNNPLCQDVTWRRPKVARAAAPRAAVTYEDAIAFINACEWHVAKVLFFLFWTGCRPEEALQLEAKDVLLAESWVAITETKTDMPRGVPLHPALMPMLAAEKKRGKHIFLTNKGLPYASRKKYNDAGRLIVQGGGHLKTALRTARIKSGVEIVPYNARHTVSTYLIWPGGVNPHIKDEVLGHASGSDMSKYYVHLPRQPLIDAIKALPDPRKMGLRADLWKPSEIAKREKEKMRDTSAGEKPRPAARRANSVQSEKRI